VRAARGDKVDRLPSGGTLRTIRDALEYRNGMGQKREPLFRPLGEQGRSRKHDSEDECDHAGEQGKVTYDFFTLPAPPVGSRSIAPASPLSGEPDIEPTSLNDRG
jgi:hypothetical protein